MTAKEALRDRIESLSEEDAAELLAQIEWDSTDEEELTPEERADVEAGFDEIRRGKSVDGKLLLQRLGLWNMD